MCWRGALRLRSAVPSAESPAESYAQYDDECCYQRKRYQPT